MVLSLGSADPYVAAFGYFDVRQYGATGDGRSVYDGSVTATTPAVVTSATAAFTATDVGKAIQVQKSDGTTLVTSTIATVNSTTQVTLTGNATGVQAGACQVTLGTDSTTGVQAAMTAALNNGGGTVYFPAGMFILAGAQQAVTAGAYTGQLLIPAVATTAANIGLRLRGAQPVKANDWGAPTNVQMPPENKGGYTILRTFATSGSVLAAVPTGTAGSFGFTNVNVVIEDLLLRAPNNPQASGFNLYYAIGAATKNVTVGVDAFATTIAPTGDPRVVYGIVLPGVNNNTVSEARSTTVYGFPTGLSHAECTLLDGFHAQACVNGIELGAAFYPSTYTKVIMSWNQVHLWVSSQGTPVTVNGMIEIESKGTSPPYSFDIWDQYSQLRGQLAFVRYCASGLKGRMLVGCKLPAFSLTDLTKGDYPSMRPIKTFDDFGDGEDQATLLGRLNSGQIWATDFPVTSCFGINGGKAYCPRAAAGVHSTTFVPNYHPTLNTANYTVTAPITTATGSSTFAGLLVQHIDANNWISADLEIHGSVSQLSVNKYTAGTFSNLTTAMTAGLVAGTTYTLAVNVTPTTITVTVNGTTQITYTKTAGEQTTYNAATALAGLHAYSAGSANGESAAGSRWTSFTVA